MVGVCYWRNSRVTSGKDSLCHWLQVKSRLVLQIRWNLWSLSWVTKIKSTHLHPTSVRSTLILSSHLGIDFSNGIFTWGLHTIPFSVFRPELCNLTCFAWWTFLHVAMGSHFPCSSFLLHGWIVLPTLIWVLLDLTQLPHTQHVVRCSWGHAPWGMSVLHERAPYWPMEESVVPSMPVAADWFPLVHRATLNSARH
jgi:hypothetical protein